MRSDSRQPDQLRSIHLDLDFVRYPEGSVLITQGNTRVLCNVTIENTIPRWMQMKAVPGGWVTAEYALLPRSTHTRTARETNGLSGRTQEIRRLIGRSLRAAINLELLGSRTCIIDCDVLQADGGTRTAAITGSYLALAIALHKLIHQGQIPAETLKSAVAAVSVGVIQGQPMLDLCYQEDSIADVDANIVKISTGEYIEVQSTAERQPFSKEVFETLLHLADRGLDELFDIQQQTLSQYLNKMVSSP